MAAETSILSTPTPYFNLAAGTSYTFEAVLNWQGNTNGRDGIMGQTGTTEWWIRENSGLLQFLLKDTVGTQVIADVDISAAIDGDFAWHHLS